MSKLPALLRVNETTDYPVEQNINTDILRPVAFNQKSSRFVFQKTGVLDANSQLNLRMSVVDGTANSTKAFFPSHLGCLSTIKEAFLQIGGKKVSTLSDLGHYSTYIRTHFSNDYRKGIASVKQGGCDWFSGSTSASIQAGIKQQGFQAPYGQIGRDGSRVCIYQGTESNIAFNVGNFGLQRDEVCNAKEEVKHRQLGRTADTTPDFAVSLSQLVPLLRNFQIPLFLIKEEVSLTIIFTDDVVGDRYCVPAGLTGLSSTIHQEHFYLMVDYLFYPSQMALLTEEVMSGGGYDFGYTDIHTQNNYLSFTGTGVEQKDYQIAMSGKKLKHIIVQKQADIPYGDGDFNSQGNYNSVAFRSGEEYQFQVESKNFYSRAISNYSMMKAEVDAVEGVPLHLSHYQYCYDGQVDNAGANSNTGITERDYNGYEQELECGFQNWIGVKMENSFGVGRRLTTNLPIIFQQKITKSGSDIQSRKIRFFVGVQRVMNISNGRITLIE